MGIAGVEVMAEPQECLGYMIMLTFWIKNPPLIVHLNLVLLYGGQNGQQQVTFRIQER